MAKFKAAGASKSEIIGVYKAADKKVPTIAANGRNLSYLAATGKLDPVYGRDEIVKSIEKMMLRHSKPNVLLIGKAGVGKTSIAEAVAQHLANKRIERAEKIKEMHEAYQRECAAYEELNEEYPDELHEMPKEPEYPATYPYMEWVVYELCLNTVVSGTQYRGQCEEKIQNIIQEAEENKNVILFIDEIHMLMGLGGSREDRTATADQAFKPALARGQIRVIGATTTDEIKHLEKDKAMMRRFSRIDVEPLDGSVASDIAGNILSNYCKVHKVKTSVDAKELLAKCDYFLEGIFPNHFIDVIDETLAGAVYDGKKSVDMTDFNATLSRMTGNIIL